MGTAVSVDNANANGQATMANSAPVTIASDQSKLPVKSAAGDLVDIANLSVGQGSTTSGQNGVLMEAAVTTGAPTYTTGQTSPLSLATTGNLRVVTQANATVNISQSNGAGAAALADALANPTTFGFEDFAALFNGTTWDRQRGNQDNISLVASAAYTTTQTTADQTNYNARGVQVVLDMTTVGTGSVTLEIDAKDPVSGKYIALLTGAAVTTNSTNLYTVYPGITTTANVAASTVLPRTWRVKVTANNANSATYSVGAMLII